MVSNCCKIACIRSLSNTQTDDVNVVVMRWLSRGPYEGIAPPKMRKEIFDFFKGVLLSCLKN